MPLIKSKSKKAFEENIKSEMDAGKPQKQSLAIAYAVKRKAPKKMAEGGEVSFWDKVKEAAKPKSLVPAGQAEERAAAWDPSKQKPVKKAKGGEIGHPASISEAIMRKRKMMAEGGEAEEHEEPLEENSEETPDLFSELNLEAGEGENYSEHAALDELDQPEDSNLMGDDREKDRSDIHSMVDKIRARIRSRI